MHCAEFEHRLNLLLDERAAGDADETLRLHADQCDRCRRLLADQELLFAGLAGWEPPALPSDFSRRVVMAYLTEPTTPAAPPSPERQRREEPVTSAAPVPAPSRFPLWLTGVLATSLVALIAAGLWWANQRGPQAPLPNTIVDHPAPIPAPLPAPAPQPPQLVDRPPAPAPMPPEILREEIALQELLGVVQEQFPEMNSERGTEIASQMVDGLRPLAAPVGDVFNVLRRTIGGSKDQSMRPRKPQASTLLSPDRGVA